MNEVIAKELEILWSDFDVNHVEQNLEAFGRLKIVATKEDLPQLLEALKSDKNPFWMRAIFRTNI
jgi:hypothetical protein